MKILALVLARGGSKRLPGKNTKLLDGKPLIVWSIEAAKNIPDIVEVLVSTDDQSIADISQEYGGYVPWLRPDFLSTDFTTSVDASIHAMDWYESQHGQLDGLLLLQPTSPFRNKSSIIKAIELYKLNKNTIVSVSPTHSHPMWTFKIDNNRIEPYIKNANFDSRSQDLDPAYILNGSIYLISPENLRKNKSFIDSETIPLIMESQKEAIDIDTEFDFKVAEAFVRN